MSGNSRPDVKLSATSDTKDKMYEPKHKKKLVRVLTVVAYVFSVSLAAITLSLFYIFIYNPNKLHDHNINRTLSAPEEPRALPVQIAQSEHMGEMAQLRSDESAGENYDSQEIYKADRGKRSLPMFFHTPPKIKREKT